MTIRKHSEYMCSAHDAQPESTEEFGKKLEISQLDIHHRYPVDCRFVVEHNRPDLPRHDHECFLFHADCEPVAVADIPVEHIAASEDDLAFPFKGKWQIER